MATSTKVTLLAAKWMAKVFLGHWLAIYTLEDLRMGSSMVKAELCMETTVAGMKAIGATTRRRARVPLSMETETDMRESSKAICVMERDSALMQLTVDAMTVSGRTIFLTRVD